MMKRFALPLLITSAVALAACGAEDTTTTGGGGSASSANAPTPSAMLTKAITATTDQKSASFQLTASVTGSSDDPQVKPFLAKPIKLDISGKGGGQAIDISGKANVNGQEFKMAVRADEQKSFIQFMDTWYGPDKGITDTTQSTGTDPAELKQTLLKLKQYGDDVLTGKVTEGDEVNGQKTWQFDGTLNPDGIVKAAAAEGDPLSADDQTGLRAIAPLVKIKFATGQKDGLFYMFGVDFKLTAAQIKLISTGSTKFPLNELAVSMTLKLSDYGTPVTIEAPANPQPTKALGGALLGAMFSMTG